MSRMNGHVTISSTTLATLSGGEKPFVAIPATQKKETDKSESPCFFEGLSVLILQLILRCRNLLSSLLHWESSICTTKNISFGLE